MSNVISRTLQGNLRVTCHIPHNQPDLASNFAKVLDRYGWVVHRGETLDADSWISRIVVGFGADPFAGEATRCIREAMASDWIDDDIELEF